MIFKQVVLGQQDIDTQNSVIDFFLCCCLVAVVLEPKKRKSVIPFLPLLYALK